MEDRTPAAGRTPEPDPAGRTPEPDPAGRTPEPDATPTAPGPNRLMGTDSGSGDPDPGDPGPLTAGADQTLGGSAVGGGYAPAPDVGDLSVRPRSLDPGDLKFIRRPPVPWLSPILLGATAVRVVLAELFGAYLDKRELQSAIPTDLYDERPQDADEVWIDYVADLGDGFDATYSVAYLLARPELTVEGETLPRGRLLVMGGDEVYPTANSQQYEDRFQGPYRSALPIAPAQGPQPTLYALPGNHDWYDGLTAFLRLFARPEANHVGGWKTRQSRSYFALRLPQRWWLFAIDIQFGAYLDEPQLRYFREIATRVRPGDKVILCPPTPGWVEAVNSPGAYDTVDYFVRKILNPTRADVRVMIAGDLHHYARYSNPTRELITCGGGGAYLYGTHRLPDRVQVPPTSTRATKPNPSLDYRRAATYPTSSVSRRLAAGVFGRMLYRNGGFVALVGVLHLLLMLAYANAMQRASAATQTLFTIPLVMLVAVVLGSTVAFAFPSGGRRQPKHWVLGLGHGLAHLGLAYAGARLWLLLGAFAPPVPIPLLAAIVTYLPLVSFAASLVVGGYLLIASMVDVNVNELFAAQGIEDQKSFLRMRIAPDGSLTIYPIAVDRVCRKWTAAPDAAADSPWIEPAERLSYRLAEPPIRIT